MLLIFFDGRPELKLSCEAYKSKCCTDPFDVQLVDRLPTQTNK